MKTYATPAQLASYYQISKSMVYKMAKKMLQEPDTQAIRIGSLIRIPTDAFQDFLERQTQETQEGEETE